MRSALKRGVCLSSNHSYKVIRIDWFFFLIEQFAHFLLLIFVHVPKRKPTFDPRFLEEMSILCLGGELNGFEKTKPTNVYGTKDNSLNNFWSTTFLFSTSAKGEKKTRTVYFCSFSFPLTFFFYDRKENFWRRVQEKTRIAIYVRVDRQNSSYIFSFIVADLNQLSHYYTFRGKNIFSVIDLFIG